MAEEKVIAENGEAAVKPKKKMRGCFVVLLVLLIVLVVGIVGSALVVRFVFWSPKGVAKRYCKAINNADLVEYCKMTVAGEHQVTLSESETKSTLDYMNVLKRDFTGGKDVSKIETEKIDDFKDSTAYELLEEMYDEAGVDIDITKMFELTVTFDGGEEKELIVYKADHWCVMDTALLPYTTKYSEYSYRFYGYNHSIYVQG